LRTLNMVAVHLGIQLFCDFLAGQVAQSRWLQLTWREGVPTLHHQGEDAKPQTR
jgi:hypothetical protein